MDERRIWSKKKNNIRYVDERFFKKWSPKMAYILGFFAADGCLTINRKRKNKYIEFVSIDYEIIKKIRSTLKSEHKIGIAKKGLNNSIAYRLQIGSKEIYNDLVDLGFIPKKSLILKFPDVPTKFLSHFTRGYFDGDGHCSYGKYIKKDRPGQSMFMLSGFTSGSLDFLEKLRDILNKYAKIRGGTFYFWNRAYRLSFSCINSQKLFNFLYKNIDKSIYLPRKYIKFNKALKIWGGSSVG